MRESWIAHLAADKHTGGNGAHGAVVGEERPVLVLADLYAKHIALRYHISSFRHTFDVFEVIAVVREGVKVILLYKQWDEIVIDEE